MSKIKFFHSVKSNEQFAENEKECVERIKKAVSEKAGISQFIDYDDSTVAFAGSKDNMKLLLEVSTQKSGDQTYLYASVDDEESWQEYDYESREEFENEIVNYIANRTNRIVKTVIKEENGELRLTSYYLDGGNWVSFEDEKTDSKLMKFIARKFSKIGETIEDYTLS